jgi:uncharacterized membrane-anchored protein
VEAFIIAAIVYFVLSLGLGLVSIALSAGSKTNPSTIVASAINILISLAFVTWGIILLVS